MSNDHQPEETLAPRWRPLSRVQRRVLGVLIEKAKTTPDQYPLSINALTNGCNQKSNRSPLMQLSADDVEMALDDLRQHGVVAEVQGGGRVSKYRHYAKDWFGIEGNELAVMAELLLRGSQSTGELRGRAARMGQIGSLAELKPLLATLTAKKLVIPLTPAGRGQIVTHGLYAEQELEKEQRKHRSGEAGSIAAAHSAKESPSVATPSATPSQAPAQALADSAAVAAASPSPSAPPTDEISEMRIEMAHMRTEIMRLREEVKDLWANIR